MLSYFYGKVEEISPCCLPVQLSYRVVPEIQVSNNEGWGRKIYRGDDQKHMRMEIDRDNGIEREGGSRTRSGKYTSEAIDI